MLDGLNESWEGQRIESLSLDSLVLWSENPRDPIDQYASNEQIIENALHGKSADSKWVLDRLAKDMGDVYDLSQLPTVSPIEGTGKYIVYDGNRRVILAMLRAWGSSNPMERTRLPLFPERIPCNVCSHEIAIGFVYRRHAETGSWGAYERDVFVTRYMGKPKSVLVRLEELVGAITRFPILNQRYVKNDVLNDKHLREFGLEPTRLDYGVPSHLLIELLEVIAESIEDKKLNTRMLRNEPLRAIPEDLVNRIKEEAVSYVSLEDSFGNSVSPDAGGMRTLLDVPDGLIASESVSKDDGAGLASEEATLVAGSVDGTVGEISEASAGRTRRTPSTSPKLPPVFGGRLPLRSGVVNNLYRTLEDLWEMNERKKIEHPEGFIGVFRMGLRLLVETASKDLGLTTGKPIDNYVNEYARRAKKELRSRSGENDMVTFIANQSVSPDSITKLLQSGAHSYSSSSSKGQTLAMSVLLGEMLRLSHGK